ncbi:uncharacterized protein LOC115881535 [Sitophilus oryzae]|uniref:Uncharacterized protein LOC115881535 n=1 Tax=Sitophilus oryzae TaxID=7048 RepID=A0A6J2XVY8_SITOR|nr:uncharacterized protein LOC115881535 [Sitophilus oryzae]
MHFSLSILVAGAVLTIAAAQFPQYPPQFHEGPPPQPFSHLPSLHRGGAPGAYQNRPPPHFNPFGNIYNPEGQKLTCRMVCAPSEVDDVETVKKPEKKNDSDENKLDNNE